MNENQARAAAFYAPDDGVRGYLMASAAWCVVANAAIVAHDRETGIEALAADIRRLSASGDLAEVATILALLAAGAIGNDPVVALQVLKDAQSNAEFFTLFGDALRAVMAEGQNDG